MSDEWVMVPREASEAMIRAGYSAPTVFGVRDMANTYRAMLAAAPDAPQRNREADRARYIDRAFNEWLDDSVADGGATVWDLVSDVHSAWAAWTAHPNYAAPAAPQQADPVAHLWQCLGLWSVDLVTGGTKAELAPPQYLLDAVAAAIRHPVGKVHSPMGPRTPDPTMVICPACTSQFTATPESVQAEVQRLKQERDGLKNRLEWRHDGGPDGISARDETIKMQDAEVRRLQEALEPFTAIDLTTNQAVDAMDVRRARRALEGK